MQIVVTYSEILNKGYWDEFCNARDYNIWMLNEGLASSDDTVTLSEEEARKYGFLKEE